MKLQIDTELKTITIEEKVNLGDLLDKLKKLFPNEEYKEYSFEVKVIQNWLNPIVIKEYPPAFPLYTPYQPYNPNYPTITCNSDNKVYNISF